MYVNGVKIKLKSHYLIIQLIFSDNKHEAIHPSLPLHVSQWHTLLLPLSPPLECLSYTS